MKIQIYEDGKDIQDFEDGYILAGDGVYFKNTTEWVSQLTRVDEITELPKLEHEEYVELKIDKIPFSMFLDAWEFFRNVHDKFNSEAIVLICYGESGYYLSVPKQKVAPSTLEYDTDGLMNIIGTIHSHNKMSAFHSSGDDMDEERFDGIHITLGNVDESFPTVSCSIMKNGARFSKRLDELFDFKEMGRRLDQSDALKKVTRKSYYNDYSKHGRWNRRKKKKIGKYKYDYTYDWDDDYKYDESFLEYGRL